MNVLICARGYNSIHGSKVGVFELDQAKALKALGCDVRIAAPDLRSIRRLRRPGKRQYVLDGIDVYTVNAPLGRLLRGSGTAVQKTGGKAYRFACRDGWQPDVMHAHFSGYMFAGVAAEENIPYVVTEHRSALMKENVAAGRLEKARAAYTAADAVIAVSSAVADRIRQIAGVEAQVVPNIVDTSLFADQAAKQDRRGAFTFVSAGNLRRIKGMDLLLDAFARNAAAGTCEDTKLIIMGDGPERNALEKQAQAAGVADRVSFTGKYKREAFAEALHGADAFVLASRGETFGVVYIEAMAAGVPVIATKCGGPEDFVTEKTGMLVPVEDPEALAEALAEMRRRAGDYDRAAISSCTRERFSPAAVGSRLMQIYENILNKGQAETENEQPQQ